MIIIDINDDDVILSDGNERQTYTNDNFDVKVIGEIELLTPHTDADNDDSDGDDVDYMGCKDKDEWQTSVAMTHTDYDGLLSVAGFSFVL